MRDILIIDDDLNFTDSKKRSWLMNHDIQLTSKDNWEDGMTVLRENEFSAVILDVMCKKHSNSVPEENVGFQMLADVLDYLDRSENDIPVAVLTGFEKRKEEWERTGALKTLSRDIPVFVKTQEDEGKLISFLKESISTSNRNYYIKKYKRTLDIIRKRIENSHAEHFLTFAMDVDNDLPLNQDRSHIVPRVLLEGMIAKIGLKHPSLNEEWLKAEKDYAAKYSPNRKVTEANIITVLKWLKKNATSNGIEYSQTIDMFLHILRIDSNEFSAHSGRNRALSDIYKYQPTINTSKALLYIMIDCVEWFEKVILNENINI